jgi:hypothetical protein
LVLTARCIENVTDMGAPQFQRLSTLRQELVPLIDRRNSGNCPL